MSAAGTPARLPLVAGYLVVALGCWAAAAVALVAAAPDLARGWYDAPAVLLAVHLLALGFLPLAVTGAALHVLPVLLRASVRPALPAAALPLLALGPALAVGVAHDDGPLTTAGATAVAAGFLLVAAELARLLVRAPRGRLLLASRSGVGASVLHAGAAFALGAAVAARGSVPLLGVSEQRLVAIHLHLAVLGWLTLLIVAVGRTLVPMLSLAPSAPLRRGPAAEALVVAGLWTLVAGLATGVRPVAAAGAVLVLGGLVRFAALLGRAAREARTPGLEGPAGHAAAGVLFLLQAAVLGLVVLWDGAGPGRLEAYVVLLLLGWAAGITVGHAGRLLALSAWTWWPPGPRPKQAVFYPRRLWLAELALFAAGVETLGAGALAGSPAAVRAGAVALACAAGVALAAAGATLAAARLR